MQYVARKRWRGVERIGEAVHVSWVWCFIRELAQWPGSRPVSCPATPSTRQMNKVFVKRHQQGTPCTWGWVNFFRPFKKLTLFLSGLSFFLSPGGITHFEKENISYQLALRQAFVSFLPPPVGWTLFNSLLIMFLFRSQPLLHEEQSWGSLLIASINQQHTTWVFQMVAIMDIYWNIYLDILWLTRRHESPEVRMFMSLVIIRHWRSRQ